MDARQSRPAELPRRGALQYLLSLRRDGLCARYPIRLPEQVIQAGQLRDACTGRQDAGACPIVAADSTGPSAGPTVRCANQPLGVDLRAGCDAASVVQWLCER